MLKFTQFCVISTAIQAEVPVNPELQVNQIILASPTEKKQKLTLTTPTNIDDLSSYDYKFFFSHIACGAIPV